MLPEALLKKLVSLERLGGPLYLVGGAIRDELLKHETRDFDLISPKNALQIAHRFAQENQGRLVELDDQRKIFRVVLGSPGQRAYFDFADFQAPNLEEDLLSRDFTINAMALPVAKIRARPLAGAIIDPSGGLKDLTRRVLKTGREKNLTDDPLRLLRTFRFSAAFGFNIDKSTFRWVAEHAAKIRKAAPERIRFELLSICSTQRATGAFKEMDKAGLLTQIFPALERARNLAPQYYRQGGVLGHALAAVGCFEAGLEEIPRRWPNLGRKISVYVNTSMSGGFKRSAVLKLAALVHDIAKPHTAKKISGRLRFFGHDKKGAALFKKIGERLRFSNEEIAYIAKIIDAHLRPGNLAEQPAVTDRAVYRFFRDLGEDGVGVLLCALADHQSYIAKNRRWDKREPSIQTVRYLLTRYFEEKKKVVPPKIVDGNDVMRVLKIGPSRDVGKILKKIQTLQVDGKIKSREQAVKYLDRLKKKNAA
ncbi:MAG: CCA tRNA nucleotidyltransferase [Elusimicrobia bacterium]|nr:CCA tRNA nucleotidyltransferase [Elusimicrobiota bacterium]